MIRLFHQYVAVKSIFLVIMESILLAVSLVCAVALRFWNYPAAFQAIVLKPFFLVQTLVVVLIIQMCCYYNSLYDFHSPRQRPEEFIGLGQSVGQACVLLGVLYYALPDLMLGRGILLIGVVLAAPLIATSRMALDSAWTEAAFKERVLILGTGELAKDLEHQFSLRHDLNQSLIGFVRAKGRNGAEPIIDYNIFGDIDDVTCAVRSAKPDKIIVALDERRRVLPVRELVRLRMEGIVIEDAHTAMTALSGRVSLATVQPSWFVFSEGFRRSRITLAMKRTLDLVCALVGLIVAMPVMLITAIAIVVDSGRPVFYLQRRVGLRGNCFNVVKFRSMRANAEKEGARWASADDDRTTRVGKFIRKYRLDEFPQFINVLRGEMSFVGPRPERPEFVENLRQQIPYYDERHTVRPGITGWAQVQYEYGGTVEAALRKLEYDLFYLKNMSLMFDVIIIVQTIRTILSGKGGR